MKKMIGHVELGVHSYSPGGLMHAHWSKVRARVNSAAFNLPAAARAVPVGSPLYLNGVV